MISPADIVTLADAYCAAEGIKETVLSSRVMGDSRRIPMIRDGGDLTVSRYTEVVTWFASNWPEGAEWPVTIARPDVPQAAA